VSVSEHAIDCDSCALKNTGYCEAFDRGSDRPIQAMRNQRTAKSRTVIQAMDNPCEEVLVIQNGWAASYSLMRSGRRQILTFLRPGDKTFVDAALYRENPYSVQAITDIVYCAFSKTDMYAALFAKRDAIIQFGRVIRSNVSRLRNLVMNIGQRTSEERIAYFLLDLACGPDSDIDSFDFPVRQTDLADHLGVTQVHVSRIMARLRERGLIELSDGSMKLLDKQGLAAMAGWD